MQNDYNARGPPPTILQKPKIPLVIISNNYYLLYRVMSGFYETLNKLFSFLECF